jgi:hypothetical protein
MKQPTDVSSPNWPLKKLTYDRPREHHTIDGKLPQVPPFRLQLDPDTDLEVLERLPLEIVIR